MSYTLFIYDERTDDVKCHMHTLTSLRTMLRLQYHFIKRGFFTSTLVS